jgi:hypothetical protein
MHLTCQVSFSHLPSHPFPVNYMKGKRKKIMTFLSSWTVELPGTLVRLQFEVGIKGSVFVVFLKKARVIIAIFVEFYF